MKNVVLYGAGIQNLRITYQTLKVSKEYNFVAIVDRDPDKIGKDFFGTPIISPDKLFDYDDKTEEEYDCIITIRNTNTVNEVKSFLKHLKKGHIYSFEDYIKLSDINYKFNCLPVVHTHVVDHCNLNCVRCSHMSPLAKRGEDAFFLEEKTFDKDVRRIAELTDGNIDEYQLGGGEPFLHPELWKFPYVIKKYLPKTRVIIITNGTLLNKIDERLKKSLIENDVLVMVTKYPINIDYDGTADRLREEGIDVVIGNTGNSNNELKKMWGVSYRPQGDLDGDKSFKACPVRCLMLREGFLYSCAQSGLIDIFNDYFGIKMPCLEENGIDIHKAKSLKEVTDFVSKRTKLCDFCDSLNMMPEIPWCLSKCEIGEWIDLSKNKDFVGYCNGK